MYVIAGILGLCLLIFVHELGHFLLAKFHKVGVLAFSIGFGPVLWKKTVGETTYCLRALPLGGYVRMVGDDPRWIDGDKSEEELLNPDSDDALQDGGLADLTAEQRKMALDRDRWFLQKSYWPKFNIVFAGPAFNFLFAIFVSVASLYLWGQMVPVSEPIIGEVVAERPAAQAGLQAGDNVLSIDGKKLETWEQLAETVRFSGGQEMIFKIRRAAQGNQATEVDLKVTAEQLSFPQITEEDEAAGDVWRIGIAPEFYYESIGIFEATSIGTVYVARMSYETIRGLWALLTQKISSEHIAGPIRIIGEAGKSAERGLDSLLGFLVFLSITLAVLNLLPIPILDGGHLVFFTIEALKGSPLSLRAREVSNQVGIALLLALMVFAFSNDIGHYFF